MPTSTNSNSSFCANGESCLYRHKHNFQSRQTELKKSYLSRTSLKFISKTETSNRAVIFMPWSCLKQIFFPTVYAQAPIESNTVTALAPSLDQSKIPDANPVPIISESEVNAYICTETGRDRLREMLTKVKADEYSPEIQYVGQLTTNCGFMVFFVTAMFGGYAARDKFVEKNKHKTYSSKFLAFRAYNDAIIFGSLRFGLKWGIKSAIFTGLFMTTAQSISVYRNKTGIIEYVAAGSLTCGLLRAGVGPRGMFAGSIIGAAFGLVGGICFSALLYATKQTQQNKHYLHIEQKLQAKRDIENLNKSHPKKELSVTELTVNAQPS